MSDSETKQLLNPEQSEQPKGGCTTGRLVASFLCGGCCLILFLMVVLGSYVKSIVAFENSKFPSELPAPPKMKRLAKGPNDWSILGITQVSTSPALIDVTIEPSQFKYGLYTKSDNVNLHIYVPLKALFANISVNVGSSAKLELLGADVNWCSKHKASSEHGCTWTQKIGKHVVEGYLMTGNAMFNKAKALNFDGIRVLSVEGPLRQLTRSQFKLFEIKNDGVEDELSYARSGSAFPESMHGIFWLDQRRTALPLKTDPDYKGACELAAEEVLMSFGEASWDDESLCAAGVSQYTGSPLAGQWTWLNPGSGKSREWSSGRGWNAEYTFCFRDATMTHIDVFMKVPLKRLDSWFDWAPESWIISFPVWLNNVGMAKTPWGWDRVTTVGPAWLRWIIQKIDTSGSYAAFGDGCHYPAIQIVDGHGKRTEYYSDYLRYVNNDTDCGPSFWCPANKGNGTHLVGRLVG